MNFSVKVVLLVLSVVAFVLLAFTAEADDGEVFGAGPVLWFGLGMATWVASQLPWSTGRTPA